MAEVNISVLEKIDVSMVITYKLNDQSPMVVSIPFKVVATKYLITDIADLGQINLLRKKNCI